MQQLHPSPANLVVHCKRSPFQVYIGRPSIWGNPYTIGKHGTRAQVIALYKQYLLSSPALLAQLPTLKGKTLGCWCSPQPCHGHILATLANQ